MSEGSSKLSEQANVVRLLEQFFELADMRCPDCGDLNERAEEFGISDVTQWKGLMAAAIAWVLNNDQAVWAVLPALEGEWPGACESVRLLLREADTRMSEAQRGGPVRPLGVSLNSPETGWVADEVEGEELEEDDELRAARRTMFDLLKRGGYDRVEVEYEGVRGVYTAEDMTFYRGGKAVDEGDVPAEVSDAVWDYVSECIPTEEGFTEECDGTARIFTASEYACFEQHAWTVDKFSDGEPGDEVPEEYIHPCPYMDELLQSEGVDFGDDDEDDHDEDDDHDEEDDHEDDNHDEDSDLAAGEYHGRRWVTLKKDVATPEALARLDRFHRRLEGSVDWGRWFADDAGGAYSAAERLYFVMAPDHVGYREEARSFWEAALFPGAADDLTPAFVEGFVVGALEAKGGM
jgi:hypothetical protein